MPTLLPDLSAAIKLYLADSTDIVAITSTRIYQEWPTGNDKIIVPPFTGKSCILIKTGVGGPGDIGLSLQDERVDLCCYGTNRNNSYILWRTLHAYLFPPGQRQTTSFTKANCRVHTIFQEGGPLRLIDANQADWPYVSCPYIFRYSATL